MRVCLIDEVPKEMARAFVRAHYDLPFDIVSVNGVVPHVNGRPLRRQGVISRALRKIHRSIARKAWDWEITGALTSFFRSTGTNVVLAEWGPTAVRVREACERCTIPLVAHFHGYDASVHSVLESQRESYPRLFHSAAAVVVVSRAMQATLIRIGAPESKTVLNAYGVNCTLFSGANPQSAPPVYVAVGRFVEKKAPQLTILAFASVLKEIPQARLRMVGDGPLQAACEDLAKGLGIRASVDFLGWMEADDIRNELCRARCFVQHSLTAPNGDCEGLPNTILEAGACGLPVIATRHAGIPDAVIEGKTGFLVNEHDLQGMADHMCSIGRDALLAGTIGSSAQSHIRENYSVEKSLQGLAAIIRRAAGIS